MENSLSAKEVYNLMDEKLDAMKQDLIEALGASEKRLIERTDRMDTRVNGRLKRGEEERTFLSKRMDAVEAWMRSKEIVSEFFVSKTKNPLVIFLLGCAITFGGTYFIEGGGSNTTSTTTNNNSVISCETLLANIKVSLKGNLITKEYYDIQMARIRSGDC